MTRRPGWTPGALRLSALRNHPDRLKVEASADGSDTATMWVYDEISWCGVTANAFCKELDTIEASTITLRLNSPGGDLFDGIAIHNSLVNHPATVNVQVDGLAASCASVIAMAGDTITMGPGTEMMIHDGLAMVIGNAADMTETAVLLDKMSNEIAGFYARRAGGDIANWRTAMLAETWYSGPEAVAAGLATTALQEDTEPEPDQGKTPVAAKFDLSIFNYSGRQQAPAPRPVQSSAPPAAVPSLFDAASFKRSISAGLSASDYNRITDQDVRANYGDLLRDAMRKAR